MCYLSYLEMIGRTVIAVLRYFHIVMIFLSVSGRPSSKLQLSTIQDLWPKIQKMPKLCQTEQPVIKNWSKWTSVSRWEYENPDASSLSQDCNSSIALDPHFVRPRLRKAFALRSQGKWRESLSGYMAVLELEPSCSEANEGLEFCASFVDVWSCSYILVIGLFSNRAQKENRW